MWWSIPMAFAEDPSGWADPAVQARLREMGELDQAVQFDAVVNPVDEDHDRRKDEVFDRQAVELDAMVEAYGWPVPHVVPDDLCEAAFLLVQHADRAPELQVRNLARMRAVAEPDRALSHHVAFLTDRVEVNAGRPQVYGTQFWAPQGASEPWPIADPEGVDARRAEVGLPPLAKEIRRHHRFERRMFRRLMRSDEGS